ncbi:MAG: response regulator [Verrucomicrobiota bacterium]|nr:response regulator [Verrucomicrobiota bacterium]
MSDSPESRGLRILVVENDFDILKWLRLYLETRGHIVFTARTLREAVASFTTSESDVLISDIGLPDGNGWELMEQLRPGEGVFAIAMSGFGMNADNARSRAVGFRHHLLKPFKLADLNSMLAEAAKELAHRSEGVVHLPWFCGHAASK